MHRMSLILFVAIAALLFTSASAVRDPGKLKKYFQEQFPDHKIVPDGHGSWKAIKDMGKDIVKESFKSLSLSSGMKEKAVDYKEMVKKYGRRFADIAKKHRMKLGSKKRDVELYIHQEYNYEECATLPSEDPAKFKGRFQFWCDEEKDVWVRQFEQDGCKGKSEKQRLSKDSPIQVKCLSTSLVEINEPWMVAAGKGKKDDVLFWECDCKEKGRENYVAGNCRLVRESKKVFEDSVKDYISLDGGDARCRINVEKEVERATTRRNLKDDAGTEVKTGVDFTPIEDAFGQEVPKNPEDFKFGTCQASEMGTGLKDSAARAIMDVGGVAVQSAFEETLCKVLDGFTTVCEDVTEVVCKTVEALLCPHTWLPWEWWKSATKWHCDITYELVCHDEVRKQCKEFPKWIKDCTEADPSEDEVIAQGEVIAQDVLGEKITALGEECDATGTTDHFKTALSRRRLSFIDQPDVYYPYELKGTSGKEVVKIYSGKSVKTLTLTKNWHKFETTEEEIKIEFTNDAGGNDVVFRSETSHEVVHPGNWKQWGCNKEKESNERCNLVREGEFNWSGKYTVKFQGVQEVPEFFPFQLRGNNGEEIVKIHDGSSVKEIVLPTEWQKFKASNRNIKIEFTNDAGHRDVFLQAPDLENFPKITSSLFDCAKAEHKQRCDLVSKGKFHWRTSYDVEFIGESKLGQSSQAKESFHLQASKPTRVRVTDGDKTDEMMLEANVKHGFRATTDEVTIELLDDNKTKLRSQEYMKISNEKVWRDGKCDTLKENKKMCSAVRQGELARGIYRVKLNASKFTLKAKEGMEVMIIDGHSTRFVWIDQHTRGFRHASNTVEIRKTKGSDTPYTFNTDQHFRTQDWEKLSECYNKDEEVTMDDERCQKLVNGKDITIQRVRFRFLKNVSEMNSRRIKGKLSSVYSSSTNADKCLDGKLNTMCHGKRKQGDSLTLTFPETVVTKVIIENRRGCCQHRMKGAHVFAGNERCAIIGTPAETMNVFCPAVKTNKVVIKTKDYLNLAQVKVLHERAEVEKKNNIDGPVDIEVGGAELTTVWGFIGLGNGKMPKDSEWADKDCSGDIWPYRGPTFGVPPIGLTLCASVGFASKQINVCIGFIFTNDGFFLPHWSHGMSSSTQLMEANVYLNLYAFASSGAAFLGNTNTVTLKYPIKKAYVASLDAGVGFTFATKPNDKWTNSDLVDDWIIDWVDHGLGPNSRLVAYTAIVGVSVSLSMCEIPFIANFNEANFWGNLFLGCASVKRSYNIDKGFGTHWKPTFKPFEVMCQSDIFGKMG